MLFSDYSRRHVIYKRGGNFITFRDIIYIYKSRELSIQFDLSSARALHTQKRRVINMHRAKFDGAEYNLAARLSSRRCCSLANEVRAWLIGDAARRVLLVYVPIICSCVLRRRLVINISRPESET